MTLLMAVAFAGAGAGPDAQTPDPRIDNGQTIDITAVEHPALIVPGKVFYVNVTAKNKASVDHSFGLFVVIYRIEPDGSCDSGTGDAYLERVSAFVKSVDLKAGEETTIRGEENHWAHQVSVERGLATGEYEVCAWAESFKKGTMENPVFPWFYDYFPYRQALRATNAAPNVTIAPGPVTVEPNVAVAFAASATDADGDTVSFKWDFGDGTKGEGEAPSHAFRLEGNFTVNAIASDGFDVATATRTISVDAPDGANPTPDVSLPLVVAGAALVALARSRTRR